MFEHIHNHPIANKLDQYTFEELIEHIDSNFSDLDAIKLARTSPYEVSQFLERLTVEQSRTILRKLSEQKASDILAEMDAEDSAELISSMREFRAIKILELLEPDDAADLVSELDETHRSRLLNGLDPEKSKVIRKLLKYSPDTAGGVMNPNVVTIYENLTTVSTLDMLRKKYNKTETMYDLYVVDQKNRLKGMTTIRDLVFSEPNSIVKEVMKHELESLAYPEQPKEEVAQLMAKSNSHEIPVIDRFGHLIGVVSHDDVIDIIQEEATKDIQILHGAGADENIHDSISYSLKKRNPWLLVNLLTAFLSAAVISRFMDQISKCSLLAAFMTIIGSLGGNSGAQTLAITIRGLALDEFRSLDVPRIFGQEAIKGLCNGLIVGIFSFGIAWFFWKNIRMGMTIFFAMTLNMTLSGIVGSAIPIFLKRCNVDPAQSSYIFLTAITDIVGLFLFLSLGSWLIV